MAKGYYYRSFVILQPRDMKFNLKAEKPAAGYCKIEVRNDRCKMYFHVQDLKPHSAGQEGYDVFLVSAQEGMSPQKIASIYVDQRGRGECTVEINVNDVAGSGFSLDQFHGLAIVHNDREDIRYLLVGYANKRIELDWGGRIKRDIGKFYNRPVKTTYSSKKERSEIQPVEEENKQEVIQSETPFSNEGKRQTTIQDIISVLEPLLQIKKQEGGIDEKEMQTQQAQGKNDSENVYMKKSDSNTEDTKESPTSVYEAKKEEQVEDTSTGDGDKVSGAQKGVLDTGSVEVAQAEEDSTMAVPPQNTSQEGKVDEECSYTEKAVKKEMLYEDDQIQKEFDAGKQERTDRQSDGRWHKSASTAKHTYWDKTKEYYTKLFETHRRVYPFMVEMGEVQWVEVPYMDDYSQYAYIGAQHIGNGYYDYYPYCDHYIVGLVKENGEVRYVAYGIPGPYGTMPSMFMQGFSRWIPSRYGYGMGYWLLYVDAYTGEIAYPY